MKYIPLEGFPYQMYIYEMSEWKRHCRQKKVEFNMNENAGGSCLHIRPANGDNDYTIIGINYVQYVEQDPYNRIQICIHEAVHACQRFYESIGETEPGHEHEAYFVSWLAVEIMKYMNNIVEKNLPEEKHDDIPSAS